MVELYSYIMRTRWTCLAKGRFNRLLQVFMIYLTFMNDKYIYNNKMQTKIIINAILTWNHKLLTSLLSKNSGSTHIILNVIDKNGCIQPQTLCATPGSWPNTRVTKCLTAGSKPYSNMRILNRKMQPFNTHDWITLVSTFDCLKIKEIS